MVFADVRLAAMLGVPRADRLVDQPATVAPADRTELPAAVTRAIADGADRQLEVEVRPRPDDPRRC